MMNANFGVKWNKGKIVTMLKGQNLLDKKIQQHVFGDILRRVGDLRDALHVLVRTAVPGSFPPLAFRPGAFFLRLRTAYR